MLKPIFYRLHDYLIVEESKVARQWEKYSGFSVQQSGRCYTVGNVLIIGAPINEALGDLIGDYFDRLETLPCWSKTKYYCLESDMTLVSPGKFKPGGARPDSILPWSNGYASKPSAIVLDQGSYRLGGYRLTVTPESSIIWRKYLGNGRVHGGAGEICGDILLLTEKTFEENQSRQSYHQALRSLPRWLFSKAFVPHGAVKWCTGDQSKIGIPVVPPAVDPIFEEKSARGTPDVTALKGKTTPRPIPSPGEDMIGSRGGGRYAMNDKQPSFHSGQALNASKRAEPSAINPKHPSGKGVPFQEKLKGLIQRPHGSPKKIMVTGLALFLGLVVFVAVFFHHELGLVDRFDHRGGHYQSHQHTHRSHH